MIKYKQLLAVFKKRPVVMLSVSAIVAQCVNMATIPALSRIYSPSDFGVLGVFMTLTSSIALLGTLSCQTIMASQPDDEHVDRLLLASLFSNLIIAVCVTVLLLMVSMAGIGGDFLQIVGHYALAITVAVVFQGGYTLLCGWAVRRQYFNDIAITRIFQAISAAVIGVVCGVVGLRPLGLLLAQIAKTGWGSNRLLIKYVRSVDVKTISFSSIFTPIRDNKTIVVFGTMQSVINSAAFSAPIWLMSGIYNKEGAGHLSMAMQIMSLPMLIIGASISQDLLGRMSSTYHTNTSMARIQWYSAAKKLMYVFIVVLILALCMPLLIPYVLGDKWLETANMAMYIGIYTAVQIYVSPLSSIVYILKRQKQQLLLDIMRVFMIVMVFCVCGYMNTPATVAVKWFSLSIAFVYVICLAYFKCLVDGIQNM